MKIKKGELKKAIKKAVRDPKNQKMLEAGQAGAIAIGVIGGLLGVTGIITGIAGSGTNMKYK